MPIGPEAAAGALLELAALSCAAPAKRPRRRAPRAPVATSSSGCSPRDSTVKEWREICASPASRIAPGLRLPAAPRRRRGRCRGNCRRGRTREAAHRRRPTRRWPGVAEPTISRRWSRRSRATGGRARSLLALAGWPQGRPDRRTACRSKRCCCARSGRRAAAAQSAKRLDVDWLSPSNLSAVTVLHRPGT